MSYRLPGSGGGDFWLDLIQGKNAVTSVREDRWTTDAFHHPDRANPGTSYTFRAGSIGDISLFDAGFFGISPREAAQMDPQQRLLLELGWEAFECAGIRPSSVRGNRVGVYIGISSADYSFRLAEDPSAIDSAVATGSTNSIAANRLSYFFDLRGPSMAIDTACSSSLVAFHQACRSIQSGEVTTALAGGVSLHVHPYGFIAFSKASMLSPTGNCNVFDASGDGYVRSEGGGIFLLKDFELAQADGDRILAVVRHTEVNTDGKKSGLTVPNSEAQVSLLTSSYMQAGIAPDDVCYVEAHGTGTAVGDPIEALSIGQAIGRLRRPDNPLPIGSVKSNLGHLESASGVAGLVKVVLLLQHRLIPATIGIKSLNPRIDFDGLNLSVITDNQPLAPGESELIAGVNSFGFGGANAHVIVASAPPCKPEPSAPDAHRVPLVLTGASYAAIKEGAANLATALREAHAPSLYDAACELATRRDWLDFRAILFADDARVAATQLEAFACGKEQYPVPQGVRIPDARGPAFIYSGNGSQYEGMGRDLLADPDFAAAVAHVDDYFFELAGYRLADELQGILGTDRYGHTQFAQPALFAVQVGLTQMLRARGVVPAVVAGHSVGEVAAAWAAGALDLPTAVRVVYQRSRLQQTTEGQGKMTAVGLGLQQARDLLHEANLDQDLCIASVNSQRGVTIAGDAGKLDLLESALAVKGTFYKRLDLNYAFHSPMMDCIEAELKSCLSNIVPSNGTIAFCSTVTGGYLEGERLNADYWWNNIRQPVQFQQATLAILAKGLNVLVEIGPHPVLRSYLRDGLKETAGAGTTLHAASRELGSVHSVESCVANILIAGGSVDIRRYFPVTARHARLPAYPWQRQRHWHTTTTESLNTLIRVTDHPLLGSRIAHQDWMWEQDIDPLKQPFLADHVVSGDIVFPGTGFVELALAAAALWNPGSPAHFEHLEISNPLVLGTTHGKKLRVTIDPADGRLTIQSRQRLSDDPWTTHAVCRVMRDSRFLHSPIMPDLAARDGSAADFDAASHLASTRKVGLDYGASFQAIERGWWGDKSATALFSIPDSICAGLENFQLHPALLDCAFQLIIQIQREAVAKDDPDLFVPTSIGRLSSRRGASPARWAHARVLRDSNNAVLAEFTVYDDRGEAIARAEDVRFRAVHVVSGPASSANRIGSRLVAMPLHPESETAVVNTEVLCQRLNEAKYRVTHDPVYLRYAGELDPLLDALCGRFAYEALARIVAKAPTGSDLTDALESLVALTPTARPYLRFLVDQLHADGLLLSDASGMRLLDPSDPLVEAAAQDIFNAALQDYPDHFEIVHAVGRIGAHLEEILTGKINPGEALPHGATFATLFGALLGNFCHGKIFDAVAKSVTESMACLVARERFGFMEISANGPHIAMAIAGQVDPEQSDLIYVSREGDARELVSDAFPHFSSVQFGALHAHSKDAGAPGEPPAYADLAVVWLNFDEPTDNLSALRYAAHHLKPNGVVIVLSHHRARWADFVFGAKASWWRDSVDSDVTVSQRSRQSWLEKLTEVGFADATMMDVARDGAIECGPFFLMARQPALPPDSAIPMQAESSHWIVVTGDGALEREWTTDLCSGLQDIGARSLKATASGVASLAAMLQSYCSAHGEPSGIIFMRELGENAAQRCNAAADLIKACETSGCRAAIWVLTQGATIVDHAEGRALRPSFLIDDDGMPHDAALRGFARSMMNESLYNPVRLLDLGLRHSCPELITDIIAELYSASSETEVVLTQGHGRFVTRLQVDAQRELPVPVDSALSAVPSYGVHLAFDKPGQLRNLKWQAFTLPDLAPDEVEVQVQACGLNFRDVMYALGLLSDEAIENGFAGATLGLEFAGRINRVGSEVTGYDVGDMVMGFGPAAFSDRVTTSEVAITHIPQGLSTESAATIPAAFFTAYYALQYLARLGPGERVLIHGAAGGVGLAAIQIAQWIGAEIFVTAGTPEKRELLRMMGLANVLDSRSMEFADDVMALTGGQGVDVILNSLAGEAITRNLGILRPFGRFLELGKWDYYENTRIGLRPFRNNITYFGIDADQLMAERPALTRHLFGKISALFNDGILHPLPYRCFDVRRITDAFRYMQQSHQIGKIVVTQNYGPPPAVRQKAILKSGLKLTANATYLVTGGLSGFGLRTAQWLADKGATTLVLLGRKGAATEEARAAIAALARRGVAVRVFACDVADKGQLEQALGEVRSSLPPLAGIVHAAAVIDDSLIQNMSAGQLAKVFAPKVDGAANLHLLTQDLPLEFFVLYSSGTTLFGNPGQAAYVAANAWLESLAEHRRALGLTATCMRWGAIDDVGYLARNPDTKSALQKRMGGKALASAQALAYLENALLTGESGEGVLQLDWASLAQFLPTAQAPRYQELARTVSKNDAVPTDPDEVALMLSVLDDEALAAKLSEMVKSEVGTILHISPEEIDSGKSIYDMGLDSLMGVELVVALESRFGVRLTMMAVSETPTIDKLAARISDLLRANPPTSLARTGNLNADAVEAIIGKYATEATPEDIAQFAESVALRQGRNNQGSIR